MKHPNTPHPTAHNVLTKLPAHPLSTPSSQASHSLLNSLGKNHLDKLAKPKSKSDIFSLSPSVYGMVYLGLIPTFALLYSTLPNMLFANKEINFLEALYFSAITVTTTGFGDITPSNTFTRGFVMVEAVVGVVLIGLFLNAINYQRQQHIDTVMDNYELKKEISFAFARLRSHDSLITLNMNTYLIGSISYWE